jgi:Na+/H+ antiporter NhaC
VSTQLPYAVTVAVCCAVGYLVAAFTTSLITILGVSILVELVVLFCIRFSVNRKNKG